MRRFVDATRAGDGRSAGAKLGIATLVVLAMACGEHHAALLPAQDAATASDADASVPGRAGSAAAPPRGEAIDAGRAPRPAGRRDAGTAQRADAGAAPGGAGGAEPDAGPSRLPDIRRVLRASLPAIRTCFENPSCQAGQLVVTATIARTGRVTSAAISSSSFASVAVDTCVADAVRALMFPAFEGPDVTAAIPFSAACPPDDADAGSAP